MALIVIAGRPVHISDNPPVIGRHCTPAQTLREMPQGWVLEESRRDRWWTSGDAWVVITCVAIGIAGVALSALNII
jgi:hypothetical protein